MVIGANPTVSAPAVGYAIKRAVKCRGAKLILIDPRQTRLTPFAHLWLRPKVGTDVVLLNGLAKVIIEGRLFDEEFVARKTENLNGLIKSLKEYTPEHVETVTGVSAQDMQLAARLLAEAETASIVYGNGITQHVNGTGNVMALANLVMLTGNIGHGRGGIFALQRENNAQGACDMGSLPDFLPGYQSIEDAQFRKKFEERWAVRLPVNAGATAFEAMEQAKEGKLKAMLVMGENPMASFPSPSLVKEALESLEILVVADIFLTETAKLATVVLPAASFAEKEGSFTNFEGRVQQLRRVIAPVGNSLADWEIIVRLSQKMGQPMPYSSPRQVMEEVQELVPLYQRLAYADFATEDLDWADLEGSHLGARRLYKGLFPSGFGRFAPMEYVPVTKVTEDEYPLTLIVGSTLPHFGGGTRSSRAPRLMKFLSHSWIGVSAPDAQHLGLKDGDRVRVASAAGEVTTTARIDETLVSGMLFMPMAFGESPVHELFETVLDPRAKTPALKSCAVKLERIGSNG
jgi:predicted molibdopterin-dependent oxidoreductase YjgC